MNKSSHPVNYARILTHRPNAWASIQGSERYPQIYGNARFYQTPQGVLTVVEVRGLPDRTGDCNVPIFALHIHEGSRCGGNRRGEDPFADVGMHYNPHQCPHPYHAGDLPPLLGVDGTAFLALLTNRFTVREVIGKTLIIHSDPDDFTTQPSGNAGIKIACGEIVG